MIGFVCFEITALCGACCVVTRSTLAVCLSCHSPHCSGGIFTSCPSPTELPAPLLSTSWQCGPLRSLGVCSLRVSVGDGVSPVPAGPRQRLWLCPVPGGAVGARVGHGRAGVCHGARAGPGSRGCAALAGSTLSAGRGWAASPHSEVPRTPSAAAGLPLRVRRTVCPGREILWVARELSW